METDSLREKIAAVQHAIWSHWMRYLFSVSARNPDGSYTIPAEKVKRWEQQSLTAYQDLSESEKESDREQADKILQVFHQRDSDRQQR